MEERESLIGEGSKGNRGGATHYEFKFQRRDIILRGTSEAEYSGLICLFDLLKTEAR